MRAVGRGRQGEVESALMALKYFPTLFAAFIFDHFVDTLAVIVVVVAVAFLYSLESV